MQILMVCCWLALAQSAEVKGEKVLGRVVWQGEMPVVGPFRAPNSPGVGQSDAGLKTWRNPLAPQIGADKGLAGVLVWVDGDKSKRTKKRGPARVVVAENQISIEQDGATVPVGLLNLGDSVTVESRQASLFTVRGRGAATFALPLVEPNKPVTRKLDRAGWVELSSGSGQYWARSWLWVGAPGSAAFTDKGGNFRLDGLATGKQTIVARLPNWVIQKFERDQETGELLEATFGEPLMESVEVELKAQAENRAELRYRVNKP